MLTELSRQKILLEKQKAQLHMEETTFVEPESKFVIDQAKEQNEEFPIPVEEGTTKRKSKKNE